MLSKLFLFKRVTGGSWGFARINSKAPSLLAIFVIFFRKKAIVAPFRINSVLFQSHINEINFKDLKATAVKELNHPAPSSKVVIAWAGVAAEAKKQFGFCWSWSHIFFEAGAGATLV